MTDRHRLTLYTGTDFGERYDLQHDPLERDNLWLRRGADVLPRPTRFA